MGESDTQIKKCTSRNHIESFELFYWLKKKRSPFVDFCALISVPIIHTVNLDLPLLLGAPKQVSP